MVWTETSEGTLCFRGQICQNQLILGRYSKDNLIPWAKELFQQEGSLFNRSEGQHMDQS